MSEKKITEAASENPARGRPPLASAQTYGLLGQMYPGITTKRGLQNRLFCSLAQKELQGDPACAWLFEMRGGRFVRVMLLAELGRIESVADMKVVARAVCARRPRVKDAAALIRRLRTGKGSAAGDAPSLALALATALDGYLVRHPDTTAETVAAALAAVLSSYNETRAEDHGRTQP
jgi:hypothetical protein